MDILKTTDLEFDFSDDFSDAMPDSYQRLLLDTLKGDASLFARADEVENAWKVIDPIIQVWKEHNRPRLNGYPLGVSLPESCEQWMYSQKKSWWHE